MRTSRWQRLEREYGKYLFLPMDMAPVKPNDPGRFKEWFLSRATPIYKNYADIASPDQKGRYEVPSFLSIDSKAVASLGTSNWDTNPVSDLYEKFPEIKHLMTSLPFDNLQVYCLWSSMHGVSPHRDAQPLIDFPFAFRINLYDENPVDTLSLHKGLPDMRVHECERRRLITPPNCNVFAWNNLRLLHSSVKIKGYMKVLMLVAPSVHNEPNLDRLEELVQRSAAKYPQHTWIDNEPITSYVSEASSFLVPWQRRAITLRGALQGKLASE